VRPPDLVVNQGEMTWQPVQPPREEEYLGEISLGLQTFESFDAERPKPYEAKVQDFQEMTFETLDVVEREPVAAQEPPVAEAPVAEPPVAEAPVAEAPAEEEPDQSHQWTELPKAPLAAPTSGPPKHEQNRSAFDTWVGRLKGRR
jgi:hypothetical protein